MVASTTGNKEKDPQAALRVMPVAKTPEHSKTVTRDHNPSSQNRPDKKKKRSKTKIETKVPALTDNLIKGSRGIDTLLRNAYRAQLDMLALAATKANIMISLNGLLMSMLIISGTHLVSVNGMYIIPIAIFLVTCAMATTFAVFAARPEISRNKFTYGDFASDQARLMVFEEFSDLREAEYIDAMTDMLSDHKRVYRSMLAHIHDLGTTADKKYQHLYYSYTVFMAGTIITVLSLLALVALRWYDALALA
ncbi:MAG: Pycsar system effector family protein [Granulosicoccus sp.]